MPSYYELIKQSKLAGGSGGGPQPVLVPKLAIENATYYPVDDEADGYSSVTVNVPDVNDIAFVPPQKFKSDGSALADYKIYGSNGIKTENKTAVLPLTFTAKAGNAVDWTIRGNDDNGTEQLFDIQTLWDSTQTIGTGEQSTYVMMSLPNGTYTVSTNVPDNQNPGIASVFAAEPFSASPTSAAHGVFLSKPRTLTVSNKKLYIYIRTRSDAGYLTWDETSFANYYISVVKGSTAPDHYIPYQKGVGERTENKMPAPANGTYTSNRATVTVTDGVYRIVQAEGSGSSSVFIDLPEFEVPYSGYINYLNSMAYSAAVVLRYNGTSYSSYALLPINKAVAIGSDYAGKKVDQMQIYITGNDAVDFTMSPMITDSNIYTAYIPYGYQVPLTVSQTGQPDKTVDIYIGDSPLTEGETVSKTSTGVDIELFEGENTVSTTLYNKPETAITYIISTGVGEEVSGSYRIPVTINSTTTNVPIGDTPLIEDEYVSYAEQKIYKYVDSVLTPVDPPSALPQISTANGENKLSIETEIQPDLVDVALLTPIELIPVALGTKTISVNDTYDASDDSLDGYSSVVVNVPSPPAPVLISKSITENGTYTAASDEADGYSEVTVNISRYSETWVNKIDFVITEVTT